MRGTGTDAMWSQNDASGSPGPGWQLMRAVAAKPTMRGSSGKMHRIEGSVNPSRCDTASNVSMALAIVGVEYRAMLFRSSCETFMSHGPKPGERIRQFGPVPLDVANLYVLVA